MQVPFSIVIQKTWGSVCVNLWLEVFLKIYFINLLASWIHEDTKGLSHTWMHNIVFMFWLKHIYFWSSLKAQWVKDPVLSLQCCRFDL